MQAQVFPGSYRFHLCYKALHLFYAGLYALVLPLICWGAQATPGHPHARAHFVFREPPAYTHLAQQFPQSVRSFGDWLAAYGNLTLCGEHTGDLAQWPANETQVPVGRSVPAQLAIATLILLGLAVAFRVPANLDGVGFVVWLRASQLAPFSIPIATPPPR
ncbi:MAG: hypothetical protein KF832_26390 [Caldilineaceae bacterium]|nr:hypothetical protein [Caldilineaceae bacterium]